MDRFALIVIYAHLVKSVLSEAINFAGTTPAEKPHLDIYIKADL
jgi:hypothetical protein